MKKLEIFRLSFTLIIFLILLSPLKSWAGNAIMLEHERGAYSLAPYIEILEDKEGRLTIEDVTSPKFSNKFIPNKNESTPSFGFTDSAYWVRFTVKNPPSPPFNKGGDWESPPLKKGAGHPSEAWVGGFSKEWLLEITLPILDRVDLYIPKPDGGFTAKNAGRLAPFNEWEIRHRSPAFYLPVGSGDKYNAGMKPATTSKMVAAPFTGAEQTYYLRFKTEGVMTFPMTLWSNGSFYAKNIDEYIVLGVYYGIISVMVLYNLFIFLSLKDRNYLFYILCVVSYGLFQSVMNGIAYEYLWSSFPWWNKHANIFFGMSSIFWIAAFTKGILMTKRHTPKLDRLILLIMGLSVIIAVLSFIISYSITVKFLVAFAVSTSIIPILAGILCWKKGYNPARYFTIAWFTFLGGVILYALMDLKLLPLNFMTQYSMQIGSALEVILFSFALADRINTLNNEKASLHKTLEMKEEYFRSLLDNSSDIITILDNKGVIAYLTPSAERILGYKINELIGKTVFDYVHPDDVARILNEFAELVKKPGTQPRVEFRFLHKDGSWRIIESIGYNLLDNPAVSGIIINTRDVTEKKAMQVELIRSEQLSSIGELAAGVAHEINNPINGIINYAQMIANKSKTGGMENDVANRIIKEGNRIASIVSNLLSFSHQDNEVKAVVPVHEILSDSLELTEKLLSKDFMNIINNARYALNKKYTENDTNKIFEIYGEEVTIDNYPYIKVTFHDRGIGIPEHIKDKIIEPFTTKPRGVGTGLGLSICYGIISDHGGKIMVDSVKGEFTKVAVLLPTKKMPMTNL
jgi:PAS domain S-box-containing protein